MTKLFRETGTNLLQFSLSGSSGYLIPTNPGIRYPHKPLRRNFSWLVPDSRNNFVTIYIYIYLVTNNFCLSRLQFMHKKFYNGLNSINSVFTMILIPSCH